MVFVKLNRNLVVSIGLEPITSALSTQRSNQLSYETINIILSNLMTRHYYKYKQNSKYELKLNFEKLFKTRIMDICYKNNITCINYLKINELNDSHFYDGAHTNKNGAIIFTKKVLKDFGLTLIQ